ncbi:MAG: ATP-binding protein, partial [Anaerolineae bacterium]
GDYHERVHVPGEDELGALAQSFNQMAATLEQTEQRRLDLIGNVAHELRTPLTSIRGIMEGLVDGVLPAEPSTYMRVQREVSRLQRLVNDLQELSRAEAGQIPIEPCQVAPAELVHAAADRLRPQFEDKGVELHIEVPAHLPQVWADSDRIIQVLINLLGNALHYTPAGGRVSIQLSVISDQSSVISNQQGDQLITDHCLLFTVQDTGIGIPPEHLPHIFERFYRVDKSLSRAGGGSGIGLTVARHLVEAHGGRIWAESAGAGQGSTFAFTLPSPQMNTPSKRKT